LLPIVGWLLDLAFVLVALGALSRAVVLGLKAAKNHAR